ncbi:MAG: hypothetical protein KDI66_15685, partial [Xanthomonadales bacterium]|nr:hypothetical protein [Xanthomonadales bacterium]
MLEQLQSGGGARVHWLRIRWPLMVLGWLLFLAPLAGWSQPHSRSGARSAEPLPTQAAMFAPNATVTEGFDAIGTDTFSLAGCMTDPVVTNGDDSGVGSLRQAIADACPDSTITFATGVTSSNLTTDQLLIDKNLTIDGGAGVTVTRVAGSPNFGIFHIPGISITAVLDSLTISNGSTGSLGGGILNRGNLTVQDSEIRGNAAAGGGGGIANVGGVLQVFGSTISENYANEGGGIFNFNQANAFVFETAVLDNQGEAAGVLNLGSALTMTNCTIAGNESTGAGGFSGGGLINFGAGFGITTTATLASCTFQGNRGSSTADDIVSWNESGQSSVTLKNTILGGNGSSAAPNLRSIFGGVISSQGNNLSSDDGAGLLAATTDLVNTDPLLAPLGNYGGNTQTHALLPGSPAINAGDNDSAPPADQRGIARVGAADIGAFESRGFVLGYISGNGGAAPGQMFVDPLAVSVFPTGAGEPVSGGLVTFTPPAAGPSASLSPNPANIDVSGVASSSAIANALTGDYLVFANANGFFGSVVFSLTNAAADLGIGDAVITEGNAATSNAVFTVTRSNSDTSFAVPYSVMAGTAQEGSDYLATSGTLTFNAGGPLMQTINVPIFGDLMVEGTETATLNLGTVTNVRGVTTVTDGSGLLTINDNDSAVVSFDPVNIAHDEAISLMAFSITLSNPVQSGVTVDLNSAFGSATAADLEAVVGATVAFRPNNNATQSFNVIVINDALNEDDEQFTLTMSGLSAVGNVTLGTDTANGTIEDDDPLPVLSITSASQPEGDSGDTSMDFIATLSQVSGRDVSFISVTADGTAFVSDNDYVQRGPELITIPAGEINVSIPVQIIGDTLFEGDESFTVNLTQVINATPTSLSGTGTIEDDDQQPTTTIIVSNLSDPSVVGQPYTVDVRVSAQSLSPLGTVMVSDGTDSCGPINLSPDAIPDSMGSCQLTSNTVGAKLVTASYTPATGAFGESSGTASHQVNAATTTISVSGPPRSRINQPIAFNFALAVGAPGAGTPTGTVTLSSGSDSCQVNVPGGSSCNL